MAGADFQGIGFRDFSGGIDALSSEDHIRDGFVQDLMNMEPTPEGYVRKRRGHQRQFGGIPLRAKSWAVVGTTLTITFESAYSILDFSSAYRLPVIIIGRKNTTTADYVHFYAQITAATTNTIAVAVAAGSIVTGADISLTVWGLDLEDFIVPAASDEKVTWPLLMSEYSDGASNLEMLTSMQGSVYQTMSTEFPDYLDTLTVSPIYPNTATAFNLAVSGALTIGPAFYPSSATPTRTRGYITCDECSSGHWTRATAAEYQSATGYIRYKISTTSGVISGTPILAEYDYLTIQDASNNVNEGTFLIKTVDTSTIASGYIYLHVENTLRSSSDFDETEGCMLAGTFTDRILHSLAWANTHFLVGDKLYDMSIVDTVSGDEVMTSTADAYEITGFSSAYAWASNVRNETLITGTTFDVYRTSSLLLIAATAATSRFVKRDVVCIDSTLEYSVLHWFLPATLPTYSATANGDGTVSVTPSSGASKLHREGGYIYLKGANEASKFQGIYQIESIAAATGIFQVTNTNFTGTEALTSKSYCLEIDTSIEHTGASTVTVPTRWYPVEIYNPMWDPAISVTDVQPSTLPTERPFFQTAKKDLTPHDSLQIDNKTLLCGLSSPLLKVFPRVGKTDLTYLHAGLPRWQPHCNVVEDVVTTGALSAGVYKYYFRLEYTDQFGNPCISAASGADSFTITAAGTSQMRFKLTVPSWLYYLDLDNIYLKVFRTIAGGSVYYQAYTLDLMKSNTNMQYITLDDNLSDDLLVLGGADNQMAVLGLAAYISTLDIPPSSKYIAALANRVVLGNLQAPLRFRLSCESSTPITAADLNQTVLYIDGQGYEFVSTGVTTSSITRGSTINGKTTYTINGSFGLAPSFTWIHLTRSAAIPTTAPDPYLAGWHKVVSVTTLAIVIQIDEEACPSPAGTVTDVDTVYYCTVGGTIPVGLGTDYFAGDALSNISSTVDFNTMLLSRLCKAINSYNSQGDVKSYLHAAHGSDIDSNRHTAHIWAGANRWGTSIEIYWMNRSVPPAALAPTISTAFFVDDALLENAIIAVTPKKFPSRLAVSYEDKPETFDATHYATAAASDSIIDVNPSDGQTITGILPFFGDSVSGSATKESFLVVFKERSVYLVDVINKTVQKLETRNLGCESPESIQYTNDGIIFGNRDGIFRLNKQLTIDDVGQFIERKWEDQIDTDYLANSAGFLSSKDRSYTFTYSSEGAGFSYWYRKENRGSIGAWSEVSGVPALRWKVWQGREYFAGPYGQIYRKRREGTAADFQDDVAAIPSHILLRPESFGSVSSRKQVSNFRISFRNVVGYSNETTTVSWAPNTEIEVVDSDAFTLDDGTRFLDNLGNEVIRKIEVIQFSVPEQRRCNFAQVKVANSTASEDLQITEVSYTVAGLTVGKGHKDAAET